MTTTTHTDIQIQPKVDDRQSDLGHPRPTRRRWMGGLVVAAVVTTATVVGIGANDRHGGGSATTAHSTVAPVPSALLSQGAFNRAVAAAMATRPQPSAMLDGAAFEQAVKAALNDHS